MPIKRKLPGETEQQAIERIKLTAIANHATRAEKTSWLRKRDNLVKYIEGNIRPYEEAIFEIREKLLPLYDEMSNMRKDMVATCIHPYDDLKVDEEGAVKCGFCGKILNTCEQ